ncbi:MAG: AMP-binding protein [Alphaproteobacteria bacterium]|nr:AMP-binding protein [Alphaproteobacteria bacterium]
MSRPWEKYYPQEAKDFDVGTMPYGTIPEMISVAGAKFANRSAATTILPNGAMATITYQELLSYANDFAAYLRETAGLQRGETVAIMTPNCIDFTIASCGAFLAGAVCTNINPLYTAPELEHQLNDSKAKVLVIIDLFGDKVDEVVAKTGVRNVVTISLLEFFPALKKLIIGFVLKRVKKVIPDLNHAHTKFADALELGSKARKGGDVASYTEGLQGTDTALFQYTSGTTGRSKGAELSHQSILANAHQANTLIGGIRLPAGDTTLVILPLYHITAFALIFVVGFGTGDHLVLVPSPRPPSNLQSAFEKFDVTIFTGINTLFAALMEQPWFNKDLFKSIRFCGSGGAAQQTGVAQRWQDATDIEIYQGYGMTECCGVMSLNPIGDNRLGSVGIPVPGLDVKIIDDDGIEQPIGSPGELLFKGPTIMKGYFGRPEATAEAITDGWLHSGDIAVMDEDGFLEIVDRKKDMILVSGFNVSPNEIEDVIAKIPGVVEVGVIGVPDEKTSEATMAFIVKNNDLTEEAVTEACRAGLTNYKVPKQIRFVDDIPKSPVGKVLRRELRELIGS